MRASNVGARFGAVSGRVSEWVSERDGASASPLTHSLTHPLTVSLPDWVTNVSGSLSLTHLPTYRLTARYFGS